MLAVYRAVAELLTEVPGLEAGADFQGAGQAGVMAGLVGILVLSLAPLTVALVQGGLLRLRLQLLLLVVLVLPGLHQAGGPLDHRAAQLSLAELEDLPASLGHHQLGDGAPVGVVVLGHQPGRETDLETWFSTR